ncbi:hypothetical protein [Pseudonocardia sp. ICBG601]|uniref:hypothetical protein n=1 Tax=Pseudonocardia sp. ICBG601 TaxID=2846759 RepID=UPI001CF71117|nr:hypothetical protein [Pseudonocardia sp. ICBG601]
MADRGRRPRTARGAGDHPAGRDDTHTSYLAGVLRMDPALVRGNPASGRRRAGRHWRASTSLAGRAGDGVAVAFNGGFKLSDPSHNGYYAEGRTVAPLLPGKASLVLHTDGRADVGAGAPRSGWGRTSRACGRTCSRSSTTAR